MGLGFRASDQLLPVARQRDAAEGAFPGHTRRIPNQAIDETGPAPPVHATQQETGNTKAASLRSLLDQMASEAAVFLFGATLAVSSRNTSAVVGFMVWQLVFKLCLRILQTRSNDQFGLHAGL